MDFQKPRGRGTLRRKKPPAGKALARLRYFAIQRGVPFRPHKPRRAPLAMAPATRSRLPYLTAFAAKKRSVRRSAQPRRKWRELGPRLIPKGQTYGTGGNDQPAVSGRIVSVAIDPSNARRILAASAGGGLWASRDGGGSWRPLTDEQPTLAMGALAFAPSDPRIVYAGTGEGDSLALLGVGLLRSTDRGASWTLLPYDPFLGQGFYHLVVDRADARHLWAATTVGLYESKDSGASWKRLRRPLTWDLSFDPASGELLAGCQDGLFRSTNGGSSWTSVRLPGRPAGEFQRIEVCHAPLNGKVAYVFAANDKVGRLWRRSSVGSGFARQTLPRDLDVSQAWYDWCAAVVPDDPGTILIGAVELYRGTLDATGQWEWTNLSSRETGDSIHPDQHHIAFAPGHPHTVYAANDGGLFRSPDLGGRWKSLNRGLGISEFEFLAQHPANDAWLLGGTQDNGTLRRSARGTTWHQVALGDGGDCCVNEKNPKICVHSYYSMGVELSTNAGRSWTDIGPRPGSAHVALFYPPLEMHGELIVQAGSSLFVTENRGRHWAECQIPGTSKELRVATTLATPSATEILVGTHLGNVYRLVRGPGGWGDAKLTSLATPRRGAYVSDIHVDRRRVWITYSTLGGGHVFVSSDGGASWDDVSGDLPSIPVNAVAVDPADSDIVYVGADNGVYRSTRGGGRWIEYGDGLPNAIVGDLVLHARHRRLRVGTRNRGAWEIDL